MATPLLSRVPAPPAAPPRGGLRAAAAPGPPDRRWTSGVIMWPEDTVGWQLSVDCETNTVEHGDQTGAQAPVAGTPYVIRTFVTCPRSDITTMAARARARLEAITSQAMALELWGGAMTQDSPNQLSGNYQWLNPNPGTDQWLNPYLTETSTGDDISPLGGMDLLSAIGAVEAEVGNRLAGGRVMLHIPTALILQASLALERRGDLLYTLTGAVVVDDYGYPYDPEAPVIYGTGDVYAWLGPITVDDNPSEVVSISDNTAVVDAQRAAMTLFDPRTLVSCQVSTV